MRRRRLRGLAALLSLALLVPWPAGCSRSGEFKGLIKVGLVASFSGRDYNRGYNVLYGAKLALKEWNDRGGVKGFRVELVAQDDQNNAQGGLRQAEKMVLDPDLIGVVGHLSSASALAALDEYSGASMPVLFTEATSDRLSPEAYPGLLRLNAGDAGLGKTAVAFVKERLAARSLAVIAGPDGASAAQAAAVTRAAGEQGLSIVYERTLAGEEVTFPEAIDGLRRANPGAVVYLGDLVLGGDLLRQLRLAGIGLPFVAGPTAANPDFVKIAGTAAPGAYYLSLAPDPRDGAPNAGFVERYRAVSYGRDPWASAVLAYQATDALLRAAEASMSGSGPPRRDRVASALRGAGLAAAPVYVYRLGAAGFPGERQP